ncbi:MAG TPA: response regulator [Lachnospiraceae bacterium]|nr:response regulator [Lachnospiraceae bacterium]
MRIVVVEDEIRIREGICKLIKRIDATHQIAGVAETGEEGLALILEKKPELVITDVKMPKMDGLQMLKALKQAGFSTKVIILSAYSEFEYAKQAMMLDVKEYLLKPIDIVELKAALSRIAEQYRFELQENKNTVKSLPYLCTGIILGTLSVSPEIESILQKEYLLYPKTKLLLFQIYLGKAYERKRKKTERYVEKFYETHQEIRGCVLKLPKDKSILLIVYGYEDMHQWERRFQFQIMNDCRQSVADEKHREEMSFGFTECGGITALREAYQTLYHYMEWNIILGDEVMVSYPKVSHINTVPCTYPIDIAGRLKTALCIGDLEKVRKIIEDFQNYFSDGSVYQPKEIKETYIRFLWTLISIAKDINLIKEGQIEMQAVLEQVTEAKTAGELHAVMRQVWEQFEGEKEEEAKLSLTVKRAQSMIHEFYQTGITLEEISNKLNITPEYLGTQFKKEIGVSFSGYIREYRLNKAKKLLLSTQLKLYEIAEAVGYTDPKYFSRQFKEYVGQSPGDYQKTH